VATHPYFSVATLAQDSWAFAWMNVQLTMPIILIGLSNGQIWLHPKRNNLISAACDSPNLHAAPCRAASAVRRFGGGTGRLVFPLSWVFPPKMGRRFSGAIFLGTLFPDKLMS